MKKLLLSIAAIAVSALTASAQWAVVGAYTNPGWNFEKSTTFTGEGDNLTCQIDRLTNSFKIVDITNNNWDVQYGTSTPIEIGVPVNLDGKKGEEEPGNMAFAGLIQAVNNATVKWNPSTATMEIVAEESDIEVAYPELWMTGSFCEWNAPGEGASVKCTFDEATTIYTCKVDLGDSANGVEFKLAGEGWSNEVAGPEEGVEINDSEATPVTMGGKNLVTFLTGEQTLTFNYNTMMMTFGDPSLTETPAERVWAVVGAYTEPNWNFEVSERLTGTGDELSCTIAYLTNSFKIVDITDNNWDIQYGTSTPLEIGVPVTLDGKNGGPDPASMSFAGLIQAVKNATVKWNPSTATLEIVAQESDLVIDYPTFYVTGSFCDWAAPGNDGSVLMSREDAIYSAEIDLGEHDADTKVEFKVAGTGWSNEIAGDVEVGKTPVTVTKGGNNLYTYLTGKCKLVFNYNEMTMYFDTESGVDSMATDESDCIYFNLQGVRVANPDKGIYIVKQGSKVSKVVK